jgi:hypothetical protein
MDRAILRKKLKEIVKKAIPAGKKVVKVATYPFTKFGDLVENAMRTEEGMRTMTMKKLQKKQKDDLDLMRGFAPDKD